MTKSLLRIVAIATGVAEQIRSSMKDDFGHDLRVQIVTDTAPCRHCLRIAGPGERVILFSYRPFPADYGPYSEIGPIFIHADACDRYSREESFPADFAPRELVIRAYDEHHAICDAAIAPPGGALEQAATFLEDSRVRYVHARARTYTCFDFQIERNEN